MNIEDMKHKMKTDFDNVIIEVKNLEKGATGETHETYLESKGKVIEISLNSTIIQDENKNKIIIPSSLILADEIKLIKQEK
jgi:small-conductance mechanosensitive channel